MLFFYFGFCVFIRFLFFFLFCGLFFFFWVFVWVVDVVVGWVGWFLGCGWID